MMMVTRPSRQVNNRINTTDRINNRLRLPALAGLYPDIVLTSQILSLIMYIKVYSIVNKSYEGIRLSSAYSQIIMENVKN